jgi:hypothetical protein
MIAKLEEAMAVVDTGSAISGRAFPYARSGELCARDSLLRGGLDDLSTLDPGAQDVLAILGGPIGATTSGTTRS